jgi:opacity protein-like surface antigen
MKTNYFKAVAFVAALLIVSGTSFAQLTHGPVGGVNLANVTGDFDEDNTMLVNFHVGWGVNFDVTDAITIQPQLLYSGKGTKVDVGDGFNMNLNYLVIPIWGRYNLESGLHFDFGPYIGFLMGVKVDGESEFENPFNGETTKYKDSFKSTDFGLGFGLGYELESGLGFAANYSLGLSSVSDDDDADSKTNVIKISVSYTLGK